MNNTKWDYLHQVMAKCEFLCIQEHWLHSSRCHLFSDNLENIGAHCISGMADDILISGRPYGGCAILWKNNLTCKIEPLPVFNKRFCAVKIVMEQVTILLCTVYMPCDTDHDLQNIDTFNGVLNEIMTLAETINANHVNCAGDMNTDVSRQASLHTRELLSFTVKNDLILLDDNVNFNVDYTYESKANCSRSIIDHFLVSNNLNNLCMSVSCDHSIDNLSDHSVLYSEFNLKFDHVINVDSPDTKLMWSKASETELQQYKVNLDELLDEYSIPTNALFCHDHFCNDHDRDLQSFSTIIL